MCWSWLAWHLICANHPRVGRPWNQLGRWCLPAVQRGQAGSRGCQTAFPEQEVDRNPHSHHHLSFPVIIISFACFYCSVSFGNGTWGEQHSEQGDELIVLLPFCCERSSLQIKLSTIISTLLWIVGWVWGFSICNGWFMKDKMCHLPNNCSDYNMMSLTVRVQNCDLVSDRLMLHPNLESLVISRDIQLPLLCQRKAWVPLFFSVSFNILLFALLLIHVVEPWLLPYC